jgi:hypothetical protein
MVMHKISALLIVTTIFLNVSLWSQKKITFSVFTGSGFSFFGGPGAVGKSHYHLSDVSSIPNNMDNPYGKKPFTNFMAGLQADMTLSSKWVLLLSSQFEHTGGRLTCDSVFSRMGGIKVDGKFHRYYDFISINPQIGRIVFQKAVTVSVHAGMDYTSRLDRGEQFDYTNQNNQKYSIGYQGGEPEVNDLRITIGAAVTRKKWGLDINYKHGLTNYWKDGPAKVYARLLHIRLLYAFWSKKI